MSARPEGRYALLVATATYRDPKLAQLRAPAADAERLAEVLRDPAKGDFEVEVLLDEGQASTTREIARFFRDRRPQDLLFLHFSCHGVKDEHGELYLASSDTEVDLLSATGVSAAWLNEQITRSRSRRTVVLLDCCFSGSFPFGLQARGGEGVNAPEQLQGRGRVIITASSSLEYAYEGEGLSGAGQPSIFTSAVVEGLESGMADLDGDMRVSVDELYDYVYERVMERTPNQTPNKKSDLEGPLYLARSSYRPPVTPATLEPELLSQTEDRYAGIRGGAAEELAALLASSDPAVAMAAREALAKMTSDDSRRVAMIAQDALDADDARTAGEPPGDTAPPASPAPAPPAPAPPLAPAAGVRTRFPQSSRLAVVATVLAAAALLVVVLSSGGSDTPAPATPPAVTGSSSASASVSASGTGAATASADSGPARPAGVPVRCSPGTGPELAKLVRDNEAERSWACSPAVPASLKIHDASLTYLEYGSAREARSQAMGAAQSVDDNGSAPCDGVDAQEGFAGYAACLVSDDGVTTLIIWNVPGTRVFGSATADRPTTPEQAVGAWRTLV